MSKYVSVGSLRVKESFLNFLNEEVLPDAQLEQRQFWEQFEQIAIPFSARNTTLLEKRTSLQKQITEWHQENPDFSFSEYKQFLKNIGYIEEETENKKVHVENVDEEITHIAGPQLVVPINNPRYAINAANARWGSLYDAFYGTDIISEKEGANKGTSYNPVRGKKVIEKSKTFLDNTIPLKKGFYKDANKFSIENGELSITLIDGTMTSLKYPKKFIGFVGEASNPTAILFKNNRLHIEIQIDETDPIGKFDPANIKDIVIESAVTSIMDCEDSITAVDTEDKIDVYRNWKGLIRGELSTTFRKGSETIERTFNEDKTYKRLNGETITLSGRVLMLVRNVGLLMTSETVLLPDGSEIYEGILDGIVTSAIAKHNLLGKGKFINSKKGSIYIVKPKMHGSEEVAFTNDLFAAIEDLLQLERFTIKMGIMDEERRTSINLNNCIMKAKNRVIFINTGYLDRTGDEIHTSMVVGPMNRTDDMKNLSWYINYELNNVTTGLNAGLKNQAQIGKGMWAKPDEMKEMAEEKINHVRAGANTAWVPSPTAATIHALHYHEVFIEDVQQQLIEQGLDINYIDNILQIPNNDNPNWSVKEIKEEIDNHIQKILGYVVRWVEQGIGCSKVPNIHDVGMMEDRATLRISSQLVANWMLHGIITEDEVTESFKRIAKIVDQQNEEDPLYKNMAPNFDDSIAFQAAIELVFKAQEQPNGYTEPILHKKRLQFKQKLMKV